MAPPSTTLTVRRSLTALPAASDKNPEVQYLDLKAKGKDIPRIYLACGTEDGLITANRGFRDFLRREGADFFYEEGPGVHNWTFWNEYLDRGLARMLG